MGQERSRPAAIWTMIAIAVALGALAAAGVIAMGHLPRLARAAMFGLVTMLALFAVLALVLAIAVARTPAAAPAPPAPAAPPPAWEPDPTDPRVGTTIGHHRLLARVGDVPWGTRYQTAAGVLDRLERRTLDDAALAAYRAASAAAHAACAAVADVETLRDDDGTPVLAWDLTARRGAPMPALTALLLLDSPAAVHGLCERIGRLHAVGQAHGALDPWHLLPGLARDHGPCFAAALPTPAPATAADDAAAPGPSRVAARPAPPPTDDDDDDDDDHLAPERRAGGPATPAADVFALAGFLAATLRHPPHHLDAAAWRELVATARAASPGARPADAAAFARAIMRTAAAVAPAQPFAGKTFRRCERCGEHLLAEDPPAEIMFDGVDRDGRGFGGRSLTWTARCVGCDHQTRREETQRY